MPNYFKFFSTQLFSQTSTSNFALSLALSSFHLPNASNIFFSSQWSTECESQCALLNQIRNKNGPKIVDSLGFSVVVSLFYADQYFAISSLYRRFRLCGPWSHVSNFYFLFFNPSSLSSLATEMISHRNIWLKVANQICNLWISEIQKSWSTQPNLFSTRYKFCYQHLIL